MVLTVVKPKLFWDYAFFDTEFYIARVYCVSLPSNRPGFIIRLVHRLENMVRLGTLLSDDISATELWVQIGPYKGDPATSAADVWREMYPIMPAFITTILPKELRDPVRGGVRHEEIERTITDLRVAREGWSRFQFRLHGTLLDLTRTLAGHTSMRVVGDKIVAGVESWAADQSKVSALRVDNMHESMHHYMIVWSPYKKLPLGGADLRFLKQFVKSCNGYIAHKAMNTPVGPTYHILSSGSWPDDDVFGAE